MIVPKTFGNLKSIDDGYDERLYKWKRVCLEYTHFPMWIHVLIPEGYFYVRKPIIVSNVKKFSNLVS